MGCERPWNRHVHHLASLALAGVGLSSAAVAQTCSALDRPTDRVGRPLPCWAPPNDSVTIAPTLGPASVATVELHPGSGRRAIRDSLTWHEFWAQLYEYASEVPPALKVDFSTHMVVAVPAYPGMASDVAIDSVRAEGDSILVVVVTRRFGCDITPALRHLTRLALVRNTVKPVRYVDRVLQVGPGCEPPGS
jgi:hypothetical protein